MKLSEIITKLGLENVNKKQIDGDIEIRKLVIFSSELSAADFVTLSAGGTPDQVGATVLELLPEGIDIDDDVEVVLEYAMTEDRKVEIQKKEEVVAELDERRKLLEELVN